jgi:hypothetical protein
MLKVTKCKMERIWGKGKEIWYICENIKSMQLLRVAGKEMEWDWKS